jgi:hypothetical protein
MVVSNAGEKDMKPDWAQYAERTNGFTRARNVVTGRIQPLAGMEVGSKDSFVFELLR